MNKLTLVLAVLLLAVPLVMAQSSGNFGASAIMATCAIGSGGSFNGSGTPITVWEADVSTSSGKGNTLVVTPNAVTGLFTRTKINTTESSASAQIGIEFCVTVDGSGAGVMPKSCVTYDERFQQVSSDLFSQLLECNSVACTTTADCTAAGLTGATCINTGLTGGVCAVPVAGTTCSTTADCATGQTCVNPTGGVLTGACYQVAGATNNLCNFELILSTLSAHSFQFVIPIGQGKPHHVAATWSVKGPTTKGDSSTESCVGPGLISVVQTKVFNNSGALITID